MAWRDHRKDTQTAHLGVAQELKARLRLCWSLLPFTRVPFWGYVVKPHAFETRYLTYTNLAFPWPLGNDLPREVEVPMNGIEQCERALILKRPLCQRYMYSHVPTCSKVPLLPFLDGFFPLKMRNLYPGLWGSWVDTQGTLRTGST